MTTPAPKRYRFVGPHLDDLADGRILEPGGFYRLTQTEASEPHNQQRITDGHLVEMPTTKTKETE